MKIFRLLPLTASLFLTGCMFSSAPNQDSSSSAEKNLEVFSPIEDNGAYTRTFYSSFPLDNVKSSLIASDASGKGPFSAYIACTEGGDMIVSIDSDFRETILCDGSIHEVPGIQTIALSGGIKATIESEKESGNWQIQFLSSREN